MKINMKRLAVGLLAMGAVSIAPIAAAHNASPDVRLSIREPVKHTRKGGAVEGEDWNLEFRITAQNAVGFVELVSTTDLKEAMVVTDEDNCIEIDLQHSLYTGPYEICADGIAEEVFVAFQSDRSDRPGGQDTDDCDLDEITRLQDDSSLTSPQLSNKAYLLASDQFLPSTVETVIGVGALTGGSTISDCSGYGRDEDLPGLVVMADVGAARVFDQNFDLVEVSPGVRRIRNLAGFLSSVTKETVDRKGRSHVVAHMHVERGMLEPLVAFDARTGAAPTYIGSSFLRRIDSGPVEQFAWDTIPSSDYTAAETEELLASLPDSTQVRVRAVLVEGDAPDFIDDVNKDGKFTIADVVAMGYTPISNQAVRTITVLQSDKLRDYADPFIECPSNQVIVGLDLDSEPTGAPGNGNGVGYFCQDGDGSSRSVKRIPQ